jgi:hypothetical protein
VLLSVCVCVFCFFVSVSVSVCLCSGVENHRSLSLRQTEELCGDLYPSPAEIAFICDALNRAYGRPKNYNGTLRNWNTVYVLEDSANGGRERRARKGAYQNIIQKVNPFPEIAYQIAQTDRLSDTHTRTHIHAHTHTHTRTHACTHAQP